jgi:hypothetical protein
MLAEVGEPLTGWEVVLDDVASRAGEEDLASMARGRDPRRAVDG